MQNKTHGCWATLVLLVAIYAIMAAIAATIYHFFLA